MGHRVHSARAPQLRTESSTTRVRARHGMSVASHVLIPGSASRARATAEDGWKEEGAKHIKTTYRTHDMHETVSFGSMGVSGVRGCKAGYSLGSPARPEAGNDAMIPARSCL